MQNMFEHFILGEQVYTQIVAPVYEKHGLTYTELTVLLFLANNPSLDTATDIVRCRNIAKSHVSVSVRALEERKLIIKEYRNGDHRSVHLSLTEQAKPIVQDGRAAQEQFRELLFDGVSDSEKKVMDGILKKIDQNMADYVKGTEKNNAKR